MSSYTFNGKAIGWYKEVLQQRAEELSVLIKNGSVPVEALNLLPEEYKTMVEDQLK